MKIQRNFRSFIFLWNHFRLQVLISVLALLSLLELGWQVAFLKFHKMTENCQNRPGETNCVTNKLKIKQCDLQFFSKNLKFMPHFTNVTKCLQKCKILWLQSLYFMVNKCVSTNYLGSCSYPISWSFWWKVHILQKNKKICKLFICCSLWNSRWIVWNIRRLVLQADSPPEVFFKNWLFPFSTSYQQLFNYFSQPISIK